MQVRSLGGKDPLEKEMASHSSILAWKIPWTQKPGRLIHGATKNQTQMSTYILRIIQKKEIKMGLGRQISFFSEQVFLDESGDCQRTEKRKKRGKAKIVKKK